MEKEKQRGNRLGLLFFEMLIKIFGLKPTYGFLYLLCLYYIIFDDKAKKSAIPYIKRRFPDSGKLGILIHIYKLFINQGIQLIDRFTYIYKPSLFSGKLANLAIIEKYLYNGDKGVILLMSHFGNWQLAVQNLEKVKNKKIYLFMKQENSEAVKKQLQMGDFGDKINIIFADNPISGMIEITSVLKQGHIVSIMGDRHYGGEKVKIPFLGKDADFPISAFHLAAVTGVPVIPFFASKTTTNNYVVSSPLVINPKFESRKNKKQQLIVFLNEYIDLLEDFIQKKPYECFLFKDIW